MKICEKCGLPEFWIGHDDVCASRAHWLATHQRKTNSSGRQTCCTRCHTCGGQLRSVLDGELWCPTCQQYQ